MNETKNNGIIDPDDPILEMIDLTEDAEEKRDAKRGWSNHFVFKEELFFLSNRL